jgi:hypothetical protein
MTTLEDLQSDPNYKNPANGRALPRHAANPHTNVDVIHGGGGGGGGGSSIDYTVLITAIKNSVAGIDADTNALAGILTAVDTLESIGTTGNATTAQILTAVSSILTQAQSTNANTDQLETLLTSLQTTLQTESDQTQGGLVDIKNAVDNIPVVLELVDYVAAVTIPENQVLVTIDQMVDQQISGTSPLWSTSLPHPPYNSFNALDAASSWKFYGTIYAEAGKIYKVLSSINSEQSTIKVFFGQEFRSLNSFYEEMYFIGTGGLVEVGYLLSPNTQSGSFNNFQVELSDFNQTSDASCTDFLRVIKNGFSTDYKADGVTSHTVAGVVRRDCPVSFFEGTENAIRTFTGYKSFSFAVVQGTVIVSDGVMSSYYPKNGNNGSALGAEFNGNTFTQSNTITITPVGAATYTWAGVK